MLDDETVQKYMTINNSTKNMYDDIGAIIPMFNLEFKETMVCPTSTAHVTGGGKKAIMIYKPYVAGAYPAVGDDGAPWIGTKDAQNYVYRELIQDTDVGAYAKVSGFVKDGRTNQDASYIPDQDVWTIPAGWNELLVNHIIIVGKDALTRTGLAGEQNAKMYVKPLGSAGVLDPIDQRQSIGFKINSVGYGSTRLEAIVDYVCIPTQLNM
jgi:hypothetical protein